MYVRQEFAVLIKDPLELGFVLRTETEQVHPVNRMTDIIVGKVGVQRAGMELAMIKVREFLAKLGCVKQVCKQGSSRRSANTHRTVLISQHSGNF